MFNNENSSINKSKQIEFVCVEDLVPKDHLVRKVEKAIDFSFIYDLTRPLYSTKGRPGIDPVILFKIIFIQYIFGISSMRRTIREIETNLAYRWFLGLGFHSKVPHHSTFSKNYERRFKNTDIFERIFENILQQAIYKGFVDADAVYIDATHVKASANKGKSEKIEITREVKSFRNNLEQEINEVRKSYGQKPLKKRINKKQ
jgi:transposase